MTAQGPTWAWCVATYNRHDVLARACALALAQSVPPAEIVVTDASADWEEGRARIARVLARAAASGRPAPRFSYEKASRPSLPAQRNEFIARAAAEVLFLLDDDTLMFPDTAERVLEVYARDEAGVVQAVTTRNVPETPVDPPWSPAREAENADCAAPPQATVGAVSLPKRARHPLALALRKALRADDRFVPYDPEPSVHAVPASLGGLDLRSWKIAAGYHLTARREAVLREPFEGRLMGYSPGEDSDATYRLTRHGPVLHRPDAWIHHIEAPGARFGQFRRTALGALNPLLLHRVHSTDRAYSARENRALLRRRLLIEFAKDVQHLDWSAPRVRAVAYALRHLDEIMGARDDEIDMLFARFQAI